MKTLALVSSFAWLLALPLGAKIEHKLMKDFPVTGVGTLHVTSDVANITVEPNENNAGVVNVYLYRTAYTNDEERAQQLIERIEMQTDHDGNDLAIEVRNRRGVWNLMGTRVEARLRILVPPAFNVILESGSGDQVLRGISGEHLIRTGSGEVELRDFAGKVSAACGSGDINGGNLEGKLDFATGSGDITIVRSKGDMRVGTGSGDAILREVEGSFRVETGSGDATLHLSGPLTEDVEIELGSGDADVRIPASLHLTIDCSTSSGDIRVADLDLDYNGPKGRRGDEDIYGVLGQGTRLLKVHTSSGDIRLRGTN